MCSGGANNDIHKEQIERNFNTQFFEGFLQECLLDIKEKEL